MPKVGMKSFGYDEAGVAKAHEEAARTGLPVEYEDKNYSQYYGGGLVTPKAKKGEALGGRSAIQGTRYRMND